MKVTTKIAPVKGIGKPDYTREISLGRTRPGVSLKYPQTAVILAKSFSAINTGVHTAAPHATIMTDAAAHFTANILINLIILNVTDGSSGIIIGNTVNTVTVFALTGGVTNQWNTGDAYVIPSPFAWVQTPLAPGVGAHIVDASTGLETPYTVPQGYTLTMTEIVTAFSEDVQADFYLDGFLSQIGVISSGMPVIQTLLAAISTSFIDPTGSAPHTLDGIYTNIGGVAMTGGIGIFAILEAIGTQPLPTTKTVRCKLCGHEETVPRETTRWICPNCSQLNIYYDLTKFRGTG